ncbi:MAG: hypothetical protein WC246_01105 [Candidatus Paceibacterota bacterium]|jgi:hypothetical protein
MAQDELLELIRKEVAEKKSRETIVSNLIFAGWKYHDIEAGFADLFRKGEVSKEFLGAAAARVSRPPLQEQAHRVEEAVGTFERPRTKAEVIFELINVYKRKALIWSGSIAGGIAVVAVAYVIYSNLNSVIVGRALRVGTAASSYTYHLTMQGNVAVNYQDSDLFKRVVLSVPEVTVAVDGSFMRTPSGTSALSYQIDARAPQETASRWQAALVLPGGGGTFVQINAIAASSTQWQAALGRIANRWIAPQSIGDLSLVPFAGPRGLWSDIYSCRAMLGGPNGNIFSFLAQSGVIADITRVGIEEKNGVAAYHFVLAVNGATARQADQAVATCLGANGFTHWQAVINGSWDFFINKKTLQPISLSRSVSAQSDPDVTMGIASLAMTFNDWNQPLSISAPQSFLTPAQADAIITDVGPAHSAPIPEASKK